MILKTIAFLLVAAPIIYAQDVEKKDGDCIINWSSGYITCAGESASGQSSYAAKRASVVIAKRNLLETVKGVQIDSETIIENGMIKSDTISAKVSGVIKGSEVISNEYNETKQSAIAKVKIHLGKDLLVALLDEAEGSAWNIKIKKLLDFISPTKLYAGEIYDNEDISTLKKLIRDFKANNDHKSANAVQNIIDGISNKTTKATGLLIDASNVSDFKNAIEVKLVDKTGKEIYPSGFVAKKAFIGKNGSSVGYDFSINDAKKNKRVFDKPLLVKALSTYKSRKSDLILSDSDIQKIMSGVSSGLQEAKVIIVMAE